MGRGKENKSVGHLDDAIDNLHGKPVALVGGCPGPRRTCFHREHSQWRRGSSTGAGDRRPVAGSKARTPGGNQRVGSEAFRLSTDSRGLLPDRLRDATDARRRALPFGAKIYTFAGGGDEPSGDRRVAEYR